MRSGQASRCRHAVRSRRRLRNLNPRSSGRRSSRIAVTTLAKTDLVLAVGAVRAIDPGWRAASSGRDRPVPGAIGCDRSASTGHKSTPSTIMKTLSLVRHASSGWDEMSLSDRARPLDPRGERDLAQMARICAGLRDRPDLIVSSPAVRALTTARAIAEGFGRQRDSIRIDDRVYAGSARALLQIIEQLDDSLAHVAVVGHNPELLELGQHLATGLSNMPTCSMATLQFDTRSWSAVPRLKAISVTVQAPRPPGAAGSSPIAAEAVVRT